MKKWLPPRPHYKKERRAVGYLILTTFLLLFLCRLLGHRLPFSLPPFVLTLCFESLVFVLPSLIFILVRRPLKGKALRFKFPRASHLSFLLAAFLTLFSGCLLLSILCGGTDSLGNTIASFESASAPGVLQKLTMVGVLALLPAFAEELLFRGILMAEYERRGVVRALVMSTLLFALIHFDPRNLPVYLFSGALLALVLYATDSLLATMLLHALYNTVSLFGLRYLNALYEFTGNVQLFLFLMILVLLLSLLAVCRGASKIYQHRVKREIEEPKRNVPSNVQLYTLLDALADPAVIISIAIAVAGCILL